MTLIDDPEHLRLRAAEVRGRAEKAIYPETRQALLRIAGDYDALAKRAEQRLARLARLAEGDDQHASAQPVADQEPAPGDLQSEPIDKPET
jgi:hypothetical protein